MTEICNDNRFELIEKYKRELLESTNIADSKEEMDVIDSILFRFGQMDWLDKLEQFDRQKEEIERLTAHCESLRTASNSIKMHLENAEKEIERLKIDNEIRSQKESKHV